MNFLQHTDSMWLLSLSSPLSDHQQNELRKKKRPKQFRLITPPTPKSIIFLSACGLVSFVLNLFKIIPIATLFYFFFFLILFLFPLLPFRAHYYNMYTITNIKKLADRSPFLFSPSFAHKFLNSFQLRWNGPYLISAFYFTYCENKTASKKFSFNVWNLKEQNQTSSFPKVAAYNYTIHKHDCSSSAIFMEKKRWCTLCQIWILSLNDLMEHFM